MDVDPGPDARDFTGGTATYDGHKGTDFRVLSVAAARKGVSVLSSADGVVKGVRDGMEDAFVTEATRAAIAGRECGNGVVLDHGSGWETQYCHMLKGSVAVKSGDKVSRGQKLGDVGYSGFVQFAHVHLEVRKDGKLIDPYSGRLQSEACQAQSQDGPGLWDAAAWKAFAYANGEILGVGFIGDPKLTETLEDDSSPAAPDRKSPALVFYARAANLRAGDRLKFHVEGPGGFLVETLSEPLDRAKATYRGIAGKRLTAAEWPAGTYRGTIAVLRAGATLVERQSELELK